MRQDRRAGEILFVDDAGQTVAVVNMAASEIREAQIFVAVLSASNYTHAEAPWTQAPDPRSSGPTRRWIPRAPGRSTATPERRPPGKGEARGG